MVQKAPKGTILAAKFQNFLGGDTPEPPYGGGVEGDPLLNPPHRTAYGLAAAAHARPVVGTLTSRLRRLFRLHPFQNPRSATEQLYIILKDGVWLATVGTGKNATTDPP